MCFFFIEVCGRTYNLFHHTFCLKNGLIAYGFAIFQCRTNFNDGFVEHQAANILEAELASDLAGALKSAEEEVEDEIRDLKSRAARDGDSGGGARP